MSEPVEDALNALLEERGYGSQQERGELYESAVNTREYDQYLSTLRALSSEATDMESSDFKSVSGDNIASFLSGRGINPEAVMAIIAEMFGAIMEGHPKRKEILAFLVEHDMTGMQLLVGTICFSMGYAWHERNTTLMDEFIEGLRPQPSEES